MHYYTFIPSIGNNYFGSFWFETFRKKLLWRFLSKIFETLFQYFWINTKEWNFFQGIEFLVIENGVGDGTPLQYSCLENAMDGGAWKAAVHGVLKSQTRLRDFPFTFHFHALKEMATHFSVLAWRIPGTGEPGELLSMWLHRVGHDWSDLAAAAVFCCVCIPHLFSFCNFNKLLTVYWGIAH